MSTKFYNYNLVDQDGTVITATNENASFPATNLKDPRSTKSFRSTTSSSVIVFDFITTEPVDSIIIVPHKLNGYNISAPITIEANATDSWGSPSYSTTIAAIDDVYGYTLKTITEQSYRFWRLSFTSVAYVEIGNIFIGKALTIGTAGRSINFGWKYSDDELAKIQTNRYGQSFIDETTTQKEISGTFSNLTLDQIDDFYEIYDYNGKTKPLYFYIDCTGFNNNPARFLGHYRFTDKPDITNKFFALYDTSIKLREVN